MATRKHPVWETVMHAAQFGQRGTPNRNALASLELGSGACEQVDEACKTVAKIHDDGFHADAWQRADELASSIIDGLPESRQTDDYLAREKSRLEDDIDSPAELAALVRRPGR